MTILWCAEFLGDYKFPYPSSSGTIAYNIVTRLLDRKMNINVADPRSSRHSSFISLTDKALGRLFATYSHRDINDLVSRLKPEKVVTDDMLTASTLLAIPGAMEIVLIARDREIPELLAEGITVVSVSIAMQEALKEKGIGSTYIPLGVDCKLFRKIERQKKGFIFGCACRNREEKNFFTLMEAFRLFNESFKDAAGLAIHTDDGTWDVRRMAKQLGIQNSVFFGNWPADQANMNRIYNTFDIHINVGEREWSALSVLESMACGTAQIVSNYGVLREYAEGCGFLVPAKKNVAPPANEVHTVDPVLLSGAMEKIWMNENDRVKAGEAALKKARTYSWENSARMWEELLSD